MTVYNYNAFLAYQTTLHSYYYYYYCEKLWTKKAMTIAVLAQDITLYPLTLADM